MCSGNVLDVSWMCLGCVLDVSWECLEYVLDGSWMCLGYDSMIHCEIFWKVLCAKVYYLGYCSLSRLHVCHADRRPTASYPGDRARKCPAFVTCKSTFFQCSFLCVAFVRGFLLHSVVWHTWNRPGGKTWADPCWVMSENQRHIRSARPDWTAEAVVQEPPEPEPVLSLELARRAPGLIVTKNACRFTTFPSLTVTLIRLLSNPWGSETYCTLMISRPSARTFTVFFRCKFPIEMFFFKH